MLRSLFGRGRKRPAPSQSPPDNTLRAARAGDVVVVNGLSLEYDDVYFVVENLHRYGGNGLIWYELVMADGPNRLWLEWADEGGALFITASDNRRPLALESIGITEADLIKLDEEHSLANYVAGEEQNFFYRNSFEAFFFQDNRAVGEGFYLWDFMAEDETETLAITKFEGVPYAAYFSQVIPPENVLFYPGERPETRNR